MDCSRVRRLLEEYFEGTLPARRREEVAAHLSGCAECAAELGQIEKVAAALAAAPLVEPRAELLRAITTRAAVLPGPAARRALVGGWRRLGVLAAVFVGVLTALRYGVPLVWPIAAAALAPAVAWLGKEMALALAWLEPKLEAVIVLLRALDSVMDGLGTAAVATGPTMGLYAAGELALVIGIVLLFRWSRRGVRPGAATFLV